MSEIEYAATPDGTQVAYRVLSGGGQAGGRRTIVYVPGALYPIEAMEDDPPYAHFLQGLGQLGRLVAVERQGIGASDPVDFDRDVFAQWAAGVVAVLDAEDVDRAAVVGYAAGATIGLETACTYPDRVEAVVGLHPVVNLPGARPLVEDLGERLAAVVARDPDAAEGIWGLFMPTRGQDANFRAWNTRAGQMGASPKTADRYWAAVLGSIGDLPERLAELPTPVLVLHRRDSLVVAPELSQRLADTLPNGRLLVVEGSDVIFNSGDVDALVAEISHFLTGEHQVPAAHRPIRTLLFTDVVDSTSQVEAVGDARWRSVLDGHDQLVRRALARHGGTLVKSIGDGALATFDNATRALSGAVELRDALAELGLAVRMGLHVGEVDTRGDDVAGVAVHLAARVMSHGGAGEIVTSAAVPLVAAGGEFRFESLGPRPLKGLDGEYELHRLVRE